MYLCREILSGPEYQDFWRRHDDMMFIVRSYAVLLGKLEYIYKNRSYLNDDVRKWQFIKNTEIPKAYAVKFGRICLLNLCRCYDIPKSILYELDKMFYEAPSRENRIHLISNILPTYKFCRTIHDKLSPIINLQNPEDMELSDIENAVREHLKQYGISLSDQTRYRRYRKAAGLGINICLHDYIVPHFGLNDSSTAKIRTCSTYALRYAHLFTTKVEYLAKIYGIDLDSTEMPYKYWPSDEDKAETTEYSPFPDNADGCVSFISGELKQRKSKPAKLLATIILAMERAVQYDYSGYGAGRRCRPVVQPNRTAGLPCPIYPQSADTAGRKQTYRHL